MSEDDALYSEVGGMVCEDEGDSILIVVGEGGLRAEAWEMREDRVEGVGEVDELFELLVGAQYRTNAVIYIAEKEVGDGAGVVAEEGMFHESYKEAGIARVHAGAHGHSFGL
eukprot:g32761.t1